MLSQLLRGEISGSDHRLSDATLRAFDQWFSTQAERPPTSSDSDGDGQGRTGVERDSDHCGSSSPGDVDVGGVSENGEFGQDQQNAVQHRSPPPSPQNADDHPRLLLTKSTKVLPVLPNRNAVYVADAILPPETVKTSYDADRYRNGVSGKTDTDSDVDDNDNVEVVLPPTTSSSPMREPQMEMDCISDDVSTKMDTCGQEEATDLSLPKLNGDRKSSFDACAADYLSTGGSSGSEAGSGSQSPIAQTPPHGIVSPQNFLLNHSAAIAAAGLFSPSAPSFPPFYQQRALQLAAMSRAAALGLPFHGKDVSSVVSKPGIRSSHSFAPNAYSNSISNVGAGKIVR